MDQEIRSRLAGGTLIVSALLEVVAMGHHPTVTTPDILEAVRQIARSSALAGVVHGVLMALMLVIVYGLSEFVLRRGATRPAIRAGIIAYLAGVIVMLGAAMVSGFIVPGLMALTAHNSPTDLSVNVQLLVLCRVLNQSCANFGSVAMSAGIAFWSIDLLRRDAGWRRGIGVAGIVIGVLPAAALILGALHLNVQGMSAVVMLQSLWCCGIGVVFVRDPSGAWRAA
jgi:hypothetical protein